MSNFFSAPIVYGPTDHFQAMQMQQQAQVNNQQAALVESCQRVDRAREQVLSAQEIQGMRQNLAQFPLPFLPMDIVPVTPLPDSLPAPVRNFIAAVARKLGVSDLMVFGSVLGAAFCAGRGAFSVKISDDYRELLTGYVLIAAESGQRKSAVSDLLRQPFKDWEAEAQRHVVDLRHIRKRNRPQCTVRDLSRWTGIHTENLLRGLDILEQHNILYRHYGDQGKVTCVIHPGVFSNSLALV